MNLSKNFTLAELCKSETALRKEIVNSPGDVEIENLTDLAENVLQKVRDAWGGFIVSSGYRCLNLNHEIGSKPSSQHVNGYAADFEVPGLDNFDLAKWISDNVEFDQLILEYYTQGEPNSGWVHCSFVMDNNRGKCLTVSKGVYTVGINR